jgi:SAM-dependent methyltransferase
MNCRFCGGVLTHEFVDLVAAPPSNAYLKPEQLNAPEVYYPLKLYVCMDCLLVQVDEYEKAERLFSPEYAYFSSVSTTWLSHCKAYADSIRRRLRLDSRSLVVEIASNDGYLLQYFQQEGIPVLGVEPTRSTAAVAIGKGIETLQEFFTTPVARDLAGQGRKADLVIGNNVLAHVPDIRDFVGGMAALLKPSGVITVEFPHLLRLVLGRQFDTIYHEHFSYLSLSFVQRLFAENGLLVFDVDELPTHGGSLRVYAAHSSRDSVQQCAGVGKVLADEERAGMRGLGFYSGFQEKVDAIKHGFLKFLVEQASAGKVVAGYGAAAKGNTLLNYCGIKRDMIPFVVDRSPHKQGLFLPGSHIPIVVEEELRRARPDYVVIFPWNLRTEIMNQLSYVREWGSRFVVAVPEIEIR